MIIWRFLARLFNSHWLHCSKVSGTIGQKLVARLFNVCLHDCSTFTGKIVQELLAQLFNSQWHNCSTVTDMVVQQWLAQLFNSYWSKNFGRKIIEDTIANTLKIFRTRTPVDIKQNKELQQRKLWKLVFCENTIWSFSLLNAPKDSLNWKKLLNRKKEIIKRLEPMKVSFNRHSL